jgi:hypothetical protein
MTLQNSIVLGDFVPSCQHQIPQQIQSNSQTKPDSINFATNLNSDLEGIPLLRNHMYTKKTKSMSTILCTVSDRCKYMQ